MKKAFAIAIILFKIVLVFGICFADSNNHPNGCTVLITGSNTTADGSILFAKTEDDSKKEVDYLWYVPRKKYAAGSVVKLRAGGMIPQVRETYAYFFDQCPATAYSNMVINEWGVAFGSNGCWSKEDPVDEVEARGDLVNGGIGFRLRFILAERSKTAREAILLAAKLLDQYGYNASGRNLNIVGPNEAWQLQMVRGKNYVARRVKEDEVAIIANTFSIRKVDINDRENFICSPNLIEYAIERNWYDPSDGKEFDFAKAYAPENVHTSLSNTYRQWGLARLLNKDFPLSQKDARRGRIPVSVKPDHKLLPKDVMRILRDHYEDTPLDKSDDYSKSPHKTSYTICNYTTHKAAVIQQRKWLPPDIGTIIWRSLDQPCSSVFIPWYLGATRIPKVLHNAPANLHTTEKDFLDYHFNMPQETWKLDLESASSVFILLGETVDANYNQSIAMVQNTWSKFEELEFQLQLTIDKTALKLHREDKSLANEFLSLYSGSQTMKSLEIARDLIDRIKKKYWGNRK